MKNDLIRKSGMIILGAGMFVLLSCVTNVLTGQTVRENRNVSGFSGVTLAFSGDVFITQGTQYKVEVEADKGSMDKILSEVSGDQLVLRTREGVWRNLGEINVYITMPEIDELSVTGSGDMIGESPIKTDELELSVSGSGSLKLSSVDAREVSAEVTGSGDIIVSGSKGDNNELEARITGSGNIKTESMAVNEASVSITGSGSASVNVLKELETNITGSGSVFYRGNPLVNATATGSGKTRSIN